MKRVGLFVVSALMLVLDAGPVLAQNNDVDRSSDLNVSIALENASQSGAAVTELALPVEKGSSAATASQQERRFEPADFARPNLLESVQIVPSDLPRGTAAVAVRCQGFIGADGGLGDYFCTADDNRAYQGVVQAVIDAVPTQRFVAARVDGHAVRVLMNFAVYVDCSSGSCVAVAARNHGYHIETLGLDYVDPQPIVEGDTWYDGFDYKLRWAKGWMPRADRFNKRDVHERMPYVIAAEVDATGIAAPACLYWVGMSMSGPPGLAPVRSRNAPLLPWLTIKDVERALESFGRVRYVPGMIDGAPATLRLFEQGMTEFQRESGGQYGVSDIDCN